MSSPGVLHRRSDPLGSRIAAQATAAGLTQSRAEAYALVVKYCLEGPLTDREVIDAHTSHLVKVWARQDHNRTVDDLAECIGEVIPVGKLEGLRRRFSDLIRMNLVAADETDGVRKLSEQQQPWRAMRAKRSAESAYWLVHPDGWSCAAVMTDEARQALRRSDEAEVFGFLAAPPVRSEDVPACQQGNLRFK